MLCWDDQFFNPSRCPVVQSDDWGDLKPICYFIDGLLRCCWREQLRLVFRMEPMKRSCVTLAASWRNTIGSCVCPVPPDYFPLKKKKYKPGFFLHPLQHLLSQARTLLSLFILIEREDSSRLLLSAIERNIRWSFFFLLLFTLVWSNQMRHDSSVCKHKQTHEHTFARLLRVCFVTLCTIRR